MYCVAVDRLAVYMAGNGYMHVYVFVFVHLYLICLACV